jgi:phospholipid/cholesterol/gamma-HCH transport system ATP-binding protein
MMSDAMIRIVDLKKDFDDLKVLKGVNLTINRGETVVVMGRSGCGKSVLLRHIIGLMRPDSGKVFVDGIDVTELEEDELYELRKRFGMLFQAGALFDSLSVLDNVGLGLREHTDLSDEEVRKIACDKLDMVGLGRLDDKKPAELSGGMKKRVGLARAIAMDPPVVLYDEPTTGLDPIMADVINGLIRDLQKRLGITSIAVTHDIKSAYKIGDRLALLYDGKIVFEGTPEETRSTSNELVRQFIEGSSKGPIPIHEG